MLDDSGSISHKKAINKAKNEYKEYQLKEMTPIEKEYLKSINRIKDITKEIRDK